MKLSRYCIVYPDLACPDSVILFSTKQASAVLLEKAALAAIKDGSIDEESVETLTELGFIVKSDEEERQEILRFLDELNEMDTGLAVMAVMNLDCNLACPYCFEGSRRGRHYMGRETARHVMAFIERNLNKDKEGFGVAFYGGEPLLSVDLIQDMAGRLRDIADKRGTKFSFTLTTNGTLLTPDVVKRLKPLGLKLASVTIDGPEDIHNVSRPYATGAGSYRRIVENVKAVCEDIEIDIGGNFREDNYREFPRLLDDLLREGLGPGNIMSVGFVPILKERAGIVSPEFSGGCRSISEPWLFKAALYLRTEIIRRGFHISKVSPTICAIDRKWMFVVNYDGSVYKCPGLIGRREFRIGDVINGVKDYSVSHGLDNWKKDECLDCVYLPLCFGGCRYVNLIGGNDIARIDCRKPFYDACLEDFVRQDLAMESGR